MFMTCLSERFSTLRIHTRHFSLNSIFICGFFFYSHSVVLFVCFFVLFCHKSCTVLPFSGAYSSFCWFLASRMSNGVLECRIASPNIEINKFNSMFLENRWNNELWLAVVYNFTTGFKMALITSFNMATNNTFLLRSRTKEIFQQFDVDRMDINDLYKRVMRYTVGPILSMKYFCTFLSQNDVSNKNATM